MGTICFAASHIFFLFRIVFLIEIYSQVARNHHIKIATTQAEATAQTFHQFTIHNQADVIQAQIKPQKIECVIDTGALKNVAIFTHNAAQSIVESIIAINSTDQGQIISALIMSHLIVSTTSHQAINAQDASKITAIKIAQPKVIALLQTAGHILLATSFAQRFIAIYIAKIAASNKKVSQCGILLLTNSN